MAKVHDEVDEATEPAQSPEIDSKYRLIILAAQRSKQLQRGARPRIEIDPTKHKPTRIALEEIIQGTVPFHVRADGDGELADGG
jgi:DNA-directed RNA polymerase omega subunit